MYIHTYNLTTTHNVIILSLEEIDYPTKAPVLSMRSLLSIFGHGSPRLHKKYINYCHSPQLLPPKEKLEI